MKTLPQVCIVALVIGCFHSFTVGPSFGVGLSSILTAMALVLANNGMREMPRAHRITILTWLFWGLSYVSNLSEALYFAVIPVSNAGRSAISGLALSLLAASIIALLLRAKYRQRTRAVNTAPQLWWRIPVLAFLFFAIYLAAGMAIHPWIASFYRNDQLPSLGQLFVWQLARGLLDICCILPVLYQWINSRREAVLVSAYVFPILCGWGPLLLPNSFMPASIRLAHGIEMGASGIAFGIAAALLLLKSTPQTSNHPKFANASPGL